MTAAAAYVYCTLVHSTVQVYYSSEQHPSKDIVISKDFQ